MEKDIYEMNDEELDFTIKEIRKLRELLLESEMAFVSYREYYRDGNEQGMKFEADNIKKIKYELSQM